MSASREKKARQELNESGYVDPRKAREAEEKAKERRSTRIYTAVIVVFVLLGVVLFASGRIQAGNEAKETARIGAESAVTIDGEDFSVNDVAYYYGSIYNTFANNGSSFGFDSSKSAREQQYTEGKTWHDYFLESALDYMKESVAVAHAAEAAGFDGAEQMDSAEQSNLSMIDLYASYSGATRAQYLTAMFGKYMTEEAFVRCVRRDALASAYQQSYSDSLTYSAADLQAAYDEDPDAYCSVDIEYVSFTTGLSSDATDAEKSAAMEEAKAKADAEAAAAVQAQIDALPSADELPGMSGAARDAAYLVALSVYDAYEDLTAEQQAQVSVKKLTALLGWFSSQVATLADADVENIWIDVVDLATGKMTEGKQNWTATPLGDSDGNLTLTGGNMYVVGENQTVTIDGDLTMAGNSRNYLILFNGAKLIINGALILEQNGLNIYSHTESQKLDTIGQITINNSENPTGAAIRSSAGSALTLNLYGGKLTAKGGEYGAVSNVYLSRGTAPYPLKAALDGKLLPLEDWAFTAVNSPANKDLVIEWCEHEDDEKLSYVDNKDNATHHLKCDLCGFEWLEKNQAAEIESQIGHFLTYTILNDTYHKGTCRECGAEIAQEKHESMKDPDGKPVYSSTLDGKGHVSGACACGYSSGTVENHNYSDYGTCTDCGFTPIVTDAVDENGNATGSLYESIEEAIERGATELWLVSYAKDATTHEYTNTLRKNLEIGKGVTLTLHMNGVKLEGIEMRPEVGPVLLVRGADLMDGTPIYDIKPYIPYADCHPDAAEGFTGQTRRHLLEVSCPEELWAAVPQADRDALRGVLANDPRPSYQHDPARVYGMEFGGLEVHFTVDDPVLTVRDITRR